MNINKAFLFGNLTRDPELKSLPSGTKVVSFAIATNRVWKDQSGAKKEDVTFHNIVAFARQAETIAQYLKKGQSVFVEGRIANRSWDDKDGQKKYRSEVIVENFQFGPMTGGAGAPRKAESEAPAAKSKVPDMDTIEYPSDEINPEDIPF
ncbi:MAG: single-stranded DNA-binding protein [Patescibacteria group bacterium]|nr:single-stranded DNA-binding protein [Patescibacteria group bacterium]MDE1945813.1 single-stranded DNA-binding protein [Patescibacteria group bacterium]